MHYLAHTVTVDGKNLWEYGPQQLPKNVSHPASLFSASKIAQIAANVSTADVAHVTVPVQFIKFYNDWKTMNYNTNAVMKKLTMKLPIGHWKNHLSFKLWE